MVFPEPAGPVRISIPPSAAANASKTIEDRRGQSQIFQDGGLNVLSRHSDGGAHAVDRRHHRQTKLDHRILPGRRQRNPALLRDVHPVGQQFGHDHQPGDDRAADGLFQLSASLQDSINAKSQFVTIGRRLDVDIRSGLLDGVGQE